MTKTKAMLIDQGVIFNNAFTTTPTCCPSRSSMLTGEFMVFIRIVLILQ